MNGLPERSPDDPPAPGTVELNGPHPPKEPAAHLRCDRADLARVEWPIGDPSVAGLTGKEPDTIALAVAADLLRTVAGVPR